ncbi:MAG: hypothetical protein ABEL51_16290 [Salinibacter sp.]
MILYLLRKYLILLTVIVLGAVFVSLSLFEIEHVRSSLPSVVFCSSTLALGLLSRRFEQRNLWVLYDNLRWPPPVLLGSLFVGTQGISLALFLWL